MARLNSLVTSGKTTSRARLVNLALTAAGKFVGQSFVQSLNEMEKAQWFTREHVVARNELRLRSLLEHSAQNVPFYRDWYRQLGLMPDELNNACGLSALPILSKSDYRQHKPETFYAGNIPAYRRMPRATSGSTGQPFQFCLDRTALPTIFASHLFYDSWHGLRPFDRYIRIVAPRPPAAPRSSDLPAATRLRQSMVDGLQSFYERLTQQRISLWEVDTERAENIWRRMEAFRPKFVMGYTSTLAVIAEELLHRNLRLTRPVSGVITTAETLTPNRKRMIEKYFDAPIINRYGLREFGSWSAQSCPESPDHFHINTELVVCEILRHDGTACAAGETGRIVLTDLRNFARPFIRYDTGDLAIAASDACSCGRGFPLLGPIEGRSLECLRTPAGGEISPAILGHFLFVYHNHLGAVRHYQLVQETDKRVNLLVVPGEAWDEQKRIRLRSDLVRLMGAEVEVNVQSVPEIPLEKSGKRPIIRHADHSGEPWVR